MIISLGSFAAPKVNEVTPATTSTATTDADIQRMVNRLEELKAMDHKNMSRSEKRKYRKEVKQIQKKMYKANAIGGGVYISAGALIVILILLIIFV